MLKVLISLLNIVKRSKREDDWSKYKIIHLKRASKYLLFNLEVL